MAGLGSYPEDPARATALLVKHGAPIDARDENGETPLHRAVRTIANRTIEILLDAGADANAVNTDGRTVLIDAISCIHGHVYQDALADTSNRAEIVYRAHTYECQTMPVSNASGKIVAGVVLVHDVTQSRALDARLRVASERVQACDVLRLNGKA